MSTINEDTYRRLKREVEDAKTAADRAKGALSQLVNQLKTEFKCESIKEAKVQLDDLVSKRDKAQKRFDDALKEYEKKWKKDDED